MKAKLLLPLCMLAVTGCTHSVHVNHLSDVDNIPQNAEQRQVVTAESEQSVVLGFVFDTDYVEQARDRLLAECPGRLGAVSTQFSTSHGFMHWTNRIRMRGICVQ